MKILKVHNRYLEEGGEDTVFASEIEMLKRQGHDVILYERSNEEIKNFSLSEKLHFLAKEIIWSQKTYDEIKKIVKIEKPDIAHIHNIFVTVSPSVYYALSEEGIPIIQALYNYRLFCPRGVFYRNGMLCERCSAKNFISSIIHGCWKDSSILTFFFARMLKAHFKNHTFQNKIDAYIATSEFSRKKFTELGLPQKRIFIKPNFSDLKVKRENYENYALFIGRLVDYKGINTLVSAYARLPSFNIKIIGDGPLYAALKKKTKDAGNIELLGRLASRDSVIEYMKKSRFVIFPSECYENSPCSMTETLACGVPILVSDRAFMEEDIHKADAALSFRAQDADDLASKIERLMHDDNLIARMRRGAQGVYEERYTPEKNYNMLIDIYERAKAFSMQRD